MSPGSVTTVRRHRSLLALVSALAVTLAACNGGDPLPEEPRQAVVEALDNRLRDGTTVTMTVDLSERARQSLLEDQPQQDRAAAERFYDAVTAGDVATLSLGEDQVGFAIGLGEERPLQLRSLGDAVYLLVDVPFLLEFFDAPVGVDEIRPVVDQAAPFLGELTTLVDAALDGGWAGVVDIPDDAAEQLNDIFARMSEQLGAPVPDQEAVEQLRSEHGFDSLEAFVNEYMQVERQEEGVYVATLALRDVFRAFLEIGQGVSPTGAPTIPEEQVEAELRDIPESVGGFVIETEGGRVTQIRADVYDVVASTLDDPEQLEGEVQEGDAVIVLDFADLDDELLQAPDDAATVSFEAVVSLVERLARAMRGFAENLGQLEQDLGGPGGQLPGGGPPQELPTAPATPRG